MLKIEGKVLEVMTDETKSKKRYDVLTILSEDGRYNKERVKIWKGTQVALNASVKLPVFAFPYQSKNGRLGIEYVLDEATYNNGKAK
jgi:hypothetical protein